MANILLRMPDTLLARLDAYRDTVQQSAGWNVDRTQLLIRAITEWLDMREAQQGLGAHVETPSMEVSTSPVRAPMILPASTKELAPHIKAIAEVWPHYERLSLPDFAKVLYAQHIYRAQDRKTGEEKPVNRGTLLRWIGQAREAGLL